MLRKTKDGGQINIRVDLNKALNDPRENLIIQTGDVIVLQETVGESMTRYFSSIYRYSILNVFATQKNLTGTQTVMGP